MLQDFFPVGSRPGPGGGGVQPTVPGWSSESDAHGALDGVVAARDGDIAIEMWRRWGGEGGAGLPHGVFFPCVHQSRCRMVMSRDGAPSMVAGFMVVVAM